MKQQSVSIHKYLSLKAAPEGRESIFLGAVKQLEVLGSIWPWFGRVYSRFFYSRMLSDEIAFSGINPGMRVLHVGCGPLPMTALALAAFGVGVTAADLDQQALFRAQNVLDASDYKDRVSLISGCGSRLDYSGYDAVWMSLHVHPVQQTLNRAMEMISPGGRIVLRGPKGWLCRYYPRVEKLLPENGFECIQKNQMLGKKSIVLIKNIPEKKSGADEKG